MARTTVAKRRVVCELRFELIRPRRRKGDDRDAEAARGGEPQVLVFGRPSVTEGLCHGRTLLQKDPVTEGLGPRRKRGQCRARWLRRPERSSASVAVESECVPAF